MVGVLGPLKQLLCRVDCAIVFYHEHHHAYLFSYLGHILIFVLTYSDNKCHGALFLLMTFWYDVLLYKLYTNEDYYFDYNLNLISMWMNIFLIYKCNKCLFNTRLAIASVYMFEFLGMC